jgi:hypothetical protein
VHSLKHDLKHCPLECGKISNSAVIVLRWCLSSYIVSSYKMTYRAILLNILILLLLFSNWVFFLAGHQSPMIPWFGLEMGFGGTGGFAGKYCSVLLSNEPFDRHIYLLDFSLAANCYNTMHHISHILNVPCGGGICEITVQVSNIQHTHTFYGAKCMDY